MDQLPEVLTDVQALATIGEDQFESALASVVTKIQAIIAAGNPGGVTPASISIATLPVTMTDGSVVSVPVVPVPPQV